MSDFTCLSEIRCFYPNLILSIRRDKMLLTSGGTDISQMLLISRFRNPMTRVSE